jgi:outer membrane protein assembly factor BamB
MNRSTILLVAWASVVLGAAVHAYPELAHDHAVANPFSRPARPLAHTPIHARAFGDAAGAALGAPTFQYRGGPDRTGIAPPISVPALEPAFAHLGENVGIHDASKASPAVDDSGIYVGFDTGWIAAFDHEGKSRWRFHVAQAERGVHATAALDAHRAYVGAYNGTLYALDKRTGDCAWALRLGNTIGSSAALVGESLYVSVETFAPPDGFVAKVDRATGTVQWQSGWLGEQAHSSPTIDVKRNLVFVGANNATFRALSAETGAERWRRATLGPVKGTAALVGDTVYAASMKGALYALDVESGAVVWERRLDGTSRSSPTYVPDEELIVVGSDDGSVNAFERATGAPRWKLRSKAPNLIASATATRDPVRGWVLLTACGEAEVCAVTARDGSVISRVELAAHLTGVPTLWRDSVFVSTDAGGGLSLLGSTPKSASLL